MNKYAYAVLCGTDDVVFGVLCFNEFFKQTNPKYPLIVICPNTLKQETLLLLNQNGLNIYVVNAIEHTVSDEYYNCVLNKFYCFAMTGYDKILYLDVDIILKKNLDFIFDEYPDSELWIFSNHDKDKHVGGNCFSVKPNLDYFKYLVNTYINTDLGDEEIGIEEDKKGNVSEYGYNDIEGEYFFHQILRPKYWVYYNLDTIEKIREFCYDKDEALKKVSYFLQLLEQGVEKNE